MSIPEERRNKPEDQNATDTKIVTNFLLLSANRNQEDMDDASIKDRIKFLSLPKEVATAHRQRELRTNRNLLKYLVFGMFKLLTNVTARPIHVFHNGNHLVETHVSANS